MIGVKPVIRIAAKSLCGVLLFMQVERAPAQMLAASTSSAITIQHAGTVDRILWAAWELGEKKLSTVYQSGNRLIFESPAGTHTVNAPGTLMACSAGPGRLLFAIISQPPPSKDHNESLLLQIYDRSGSLVFAESLQWSVDAPVPTVALDEVNHRAIIADPANSELVILELTVGKKAQTMTLFEGARYSLEKSMLVRVCHDGSLVVAAMREDALPQYGISQQRNLGLVALASDGRELWRHELAGPSLHALAVSPNGEMLAIASYDGFVTTGSGTMTRIFSRKGTEFFQSDRLFQYAVWDDDSNAAVLVSRHEARRYDLQNGVLQFDFKLQDRGSIIVAAEFLPAFARIMLLTARPVLAGDGFQMQEGRLIILDREGEILDQRELLDGTLIEPFITLLGSDNLFACHYRDATVVMSLQ